MTERPILFSAPMVRAVARQVDPKTQTRRVVKPSVKGCTVGVYTSDDDGFIQPVNVQEDGDPWEDIPCPYGQPGDRLWVRETWAVGHGYDGMPPRAIPELPFVNRHYAATEDRGGLLWRPSIHMPRWLSRITLEVTGVRVERLNEISEADCIAEGIDGFEFCGERFWRDYLLTDEEAQCSPALTDPRASYRTLWESINGAGSWAANPWVWVVEFRRLPP